MARRLQYNIGEEKIPHIASVFTLLVGLLVLAGWIFDIDILKSLLPGFGGAKANTAIALILAALSLWCLQQRRATWAKLSGRLWASLVVLIGLLTLTQDIWGWDLGIDQLLIAEPPRLGGTFAPGRMAPSTAVNFLLLGLSLLLLDIKSRRLWRPSELLAAGAVANCLFVLIGYAHNVDLYSPLVHVEMALVTALACIALALGVLFSRTNQGLVSTVINSRFSLSPRVIGLVVMIVVLGGGSVSIVMTYQIRNTLHDQIVASNIAAVDLAAEFASSYVQSAKTSLERFASRPSVVASVLDGKFADVTSELQTFLQLSPQLDGFSIASADGLVRATGNIPAIVGISVTDREWFQRVIKTAKPYLGIPVISRGTNRPSVPYGVPLLDEQGRVRAALVGGISIARLSDAITKFQTGPSSRTSLADLRGGGIILAHADRKRILTAISGRNTAVQRMLKGERDAMEASDSVGRLNLAVFAPVPDLPWSVLMLQPSEVAFAPITTAVRRGLFTIFGVLILAGGVGSWLAHYLIRPIARMRDAAHAFAAGDLSQRLNFSRQDELGELGRTFDQMATTLEINTATLQATNKELEAFTYSVSHDLRAPLRGIDGFSKILLEKFSAQLPSDGQRYLRLVRENSQQMGRLIDDMLAFSRLAGQPLRKQPMMPADTVRQCLEELDSERRKRTVEISVSDLPCCQADPSLLKQLWMNLLSNAVKYTRKQEAARIEVGSQSNGGPLVYYVKDNGVGFDMQYAGKLFGVFQRFHRAEEYEGTGVGLAIAQRIVHRHGGRIWADSAVNSGTTFFFTLEGGH